MDRLLICACIVVLLLPGCNGEWIGDLIWFDRRTVQVNPSCSEENVRKAIIGIEDVVIDDALSSPADIAIKTKARYHSRNLFGRVQRVSPTTVNLYFTGKGALEPDNAREMVTPILASITDAIRLKCGP